MAEISIIVPVYKGVRFLREALGSVRAQTFADWECLCVDDGSKDGSGRLLDEIAANDSRIVAFHCENGGTSVARNFALARATGRYVAFLDEDDVYHPQYLEILHAFAERTGADVVGCEFEKFDEQGHPSLSGPTPDSCSSQTADRARLREWVCDYYDGVPFEVWRNLYRRELVWNHDFRPGVRVEQDLLWHYTLLPRINRYVRLAWTGYGWRRNSNGGYLHPDAKSLVSLSQSSRTVFETVTERLGLSDGQRARFSHAMTLDLKYHIWESLRRGVPLSRENSAELRHGLSDLARLGPDIGLELKWARRLKWRLFLQTGIRDL